MVSPFRLGAHHPVLLQDMPRTRRHCYATAAKMLVFEKSSSLQTLKLWRGTITQYVCVANCATHQLMHTHIDKQKGWDRKGQHSTVRRGAALRGGAAQTTKDGVEWRMGRRVWEACRHIDTWTQRRTNTKHNETCTCTCAHKHNHTTTFKTKKPNQVEQEVQVQLQDRTRAPNPDLRDYGLSGS